MKILHLTERYFPFLGGVESAVHEICKRLVRDGFQVDVVCEREKGSVKHEVIDGVNVHRIMGFELIKLKYGVGRVAPSMILSALKNNADVVHAHSYGFFPSWVSMFSKKPTIITTHSDPAAKIYPIWDLFRAIPIRFCDHVIATTEMEKNHLICKGVKPTNITVIPNGITLPPPQSPKTNSSSVILCLARLDVIHKGHDILLRAMPKVAKVIPKVMLVIAGQGNDLRKLKKLSKKLGIEKNVDFKGLISQSKKNDLMQNCSVLCISPRTESFGIVYLEAMAYGKPIVTTRVGGIPEVVGNCAVLVPPNNPELLAEALIEVLTNKKRAKELGLKGLKRIKEFDWDILIKKYEQLCKKLISK